MKYRKKPVVIEAILWDGNQVNEFPEWLKEPWNTGEVMRMGKVVHIVTLEGVMTASAGDYIIRGVNGELYPCKPDIFEKTYEAVEQL
jgi:hypothetical protein